MEKEHQPNAPCPQPKCTGKLTLNATEVVEGSRINPGRDLTCDKCGHIVKRAKA